MDDVLSLLALQILFCQCCQCSHCCRFNSEDNASPLYLTEDAEDSHFFKSLPAEVVKNLQRKPLAMENHANGKHSRHPFYRACHSLADCAS